MTEETKEPGASAVLGGQNERLVMLEDASWLTGGSADSGLDYCRACAEQERVMFGDDCVVDGGWQTEHDTPPQCESCYKPLAATLLGEHWRNININTRDEWMNAVNEEA